MGGCGVLLYAKKIKNIFFSIFFQIKNAMPGSSASFEVNPILKIIPPKWKIDEDLRY